MDVDLLVVAPLTAHTLARLAHGLADDLLTETALAHRGPVLVAPAMNSAMWEHAATQANLATLVARGVHVIGPEDGELAEGETGPGRMAEPEAVFERVSGDPRRRGSGGDGERLVDRPPRGRVGRRHARAARRRQIPRQPLLRVAWGSRSRPRRGAVAPR